MAHVFLVWLTLVAAADEPGRKESFLSRPPKVGDLVPDLVAYDEAGKPFRLRDRMRGSYTVLVFGCLT